MLNHYVYILSIVAPSKLLLLRCTAFISIELGPTDFIGMKKIYSIAYYTEFKDEDKGAGSGGW